MKRYITAILGMFMVFQTTAQVAINTNGTAANSSAMLDVQSTSRGMLIPRMTTSQRLAITPVKGLLVFDNTTSSFWFYNGTAWSELAAGSDNKWSTYGNDVYNTNSGKVGIGTYLPTEKLDVSGNIRSRGRVDADGVIEGNGVSSLGAFYVSGTSLMTGAVTGNSSASFGGNINSNTGMSIKDDAGTLSLQSSGGADKGFVQLSGENLRIGTYSSNTAGKLIMRLNGADHVIVENDGKTGIGQDDPQAKLHINSGASIEALRLTGNTNTIMRFMTGGTEKASIYSSGNHLSLNVAQPGGQVRLGGEVYIDEDLSRVGVGTTLPEERLHVAGNIKTNSGKVLNSDNMNMIPVAMGYFDEYGNKVRGTSNISVIRKTANSSFHYFEITVTGQTDLGNAIISATGVGPQQWASAYGNTGTNKATVMIFENIVSEETTWKPFHIIIYN